MNHIFELQKVWDGLDVRITGLNGHSNVYIAKVCSRHSGLCPRTARWGWKNLSSLKSRPEHIVFLYVFVGFVMFWAYVASDMYPGITAENLYLPLFQTFGTAWVACRHSLELALFPVGIELKKRTSMDRHASCIQDLRSLKLAEEGGWFFSGTDWIGLVHHHLTAYQQSNVTFATCFIVNWSWDFPWLASCHNWKQSVSNYTIQQSHTLLIIPLPTHTHMIISPRHGHRPAHHHHGHQH